LISERKARVTDLNFVLKSLVTEFSLKTLSRLRRRSDNWGRAVVLKRLYEGKEAGAGGSGKKGFLEAYRRKRVF